MEYVLFEDSARLDLLPFTFTRPVSDIRVGIDTLADKWARHLGQAPGQLAAPEHQALFAKAPKGSDAVFVNSKLVPETRLVRYLENLAPKTVLTGQQGEILAFRCNPADLPPDLEFVRPNALAFLQAEVAYPHAAELLAVRFPWDIFRLNGAVLRKDFAELTAGRTSEPVTDKHTVVYGSENVFIEPGVKIRAAVLNAEDGPIYIGAKADIQEGVLIHGAHALCTGTMVNMGAKLRGDSTFGPYCKVGGEVSNTVFFGYSNKGHDGFLGNSVLGTWCNLGADTNTSNLKNNYGSVRVYSHRTGKSEDTGLTFCGLLMGDHGKSGINTMFNTGTVVGVCANVFGAGFPEKFIPSFSWGGADSGFEEFQLEKAHEVAERMMARRSLTLTASERDLLAHVFQLTARQRVLL